ncbi:MAG: flagellar hook-basal body complex protein [Burkholderiales bacterium]|nr:flagellar hook-basal body complex protein [Burkholderiales bacterium]
MRRRVATLIVATTLLALAACGGGEADGPVGRVQAQQMPAASTAVETGRALDLSIAGDGQFVWRTDGGQTVYSREASLGLSAAHHLVNRSGARLMGTPPGAGDAAALAPLEVPERMPPRVTTRVSMEFNLDSRLSVTDFGFTPRIDLSNARTYNNATSVCVFDAKGQPVALTLYVQKFADDQWNVYFTANGKTVAGTAEDPQPVATVTFRADGSIPSPASITLDIPVTVNQYGAQTLPIAGLVIDLSRATQYGSPFSVTDLAQDGLATGSLVSLQVESGGGLTAEYSNGQRIDRGRIMLARFAGTERFMPTAQGWQQVSGAAPVITAPGLGLNGTLRTGAVETDAQLRSQTGH